jgi:hypothetical protein
MIRHLLKNDLKKMSKILIYMQVITLAFAGLTAIFKIWDDINAINIIALVLAGVTYSAIANVLVNTFVHTLKNVNTSFYKDESYLTHTLPVTKTELITSKYVAALILVIASITISLISLFLVLYSPEMATLIKNFLTTSLLEFNLKPSVFIGLLSGCMLAQVCMLTSLAFFTIIKSNSYGEKRLIKGIVWFLILYFIYTLTTFVFGIIIIACMGRINELATEIPSQQTVLALIITQFVFSVVYSVVFFFIAKREFNKGVNVD